VPAKKDVGASQNARLAKAVPVVGSILATQNTPAARKSGNFSFPLTISQVRSNHCKPWKIGYFIGLMLYHIPPVLTTHLESGLDFRNPVPEALS
jgi:hypothetical protein